MSADVTITRTEPIRVARVTGIADSADHEEVGPLAQRLFGQVMEAVLGGGVPMAGPAMATYQPTADGKLTVAACCPVGPEATGTDVYEVVELPAQSRVAAYLHAGPTATIGQAYQALAEWIEAEGHRTDGSAREVYLVSHPEPQERWQTELQMPLEV